MSSLHSLRRKRIFILVTMFALLAGLFAFNMMRPSKEEKLVSLYSDRILSNDLQGATEDERQSFRRDLENLSPETRDEIMRKVMRGRMDQMRSEISGLTAEERKARIDEAVEKMRERHKKMTKEEREKARERMTSEEARVMIEKVMGFYQTELSAQERADLDPLMQEWFRQIEAIAK